MGVIVWIGRSRVRIQWSSAITSRSFAAYFMRRLVLSLPVLVLVLAWWLVATLWVVCWVGSSIHACSSATSSSGSRKFVDLLWASILAWTLCNWADGAAAVRRLHARMLGDFRDGPAGWVGCASVSAAETEPD